MGWVLRLVETGIDSPARVIDVLDIRPLGGLAEIAKLGLTLAEAKRILARLQQSGGRRPSRRPRRPASGLLLVRSCLSRQGLAGSSGGNAVWHRAGAPPAVSLCPAVVMARWVSAGRPIAGPRLSSTSCAHMFLL
jgi:hypothetical protein